jgi:hypothetical protein
MKRTEGVYHAEQVYNQLVILSTEVFDGTNDLLHATLVDLGRQLLYDRKDL